MQIGKEYKDNKMNVWLIKWLYFSSVLFLFCVSTFVTLINAACSGRWIAVDVLSKIRLMNLQDRATSENA